MIPSANGRFTNISHRLLAEGEDGEEVIIERFLDNHDLLTYLSEIGLRLRDYIKIVKHEPLRGRSWLSD